MRFATFNTSRALLLAGLIGAVQVLQIGGATAHRGTFDIAGALENTVFDAQVAQWSLEVAFSDISTVVVDGPLGQFVGDWHVHEDQLCVEFAEGPRKGFTCETVAMIDTDHLRVGETLTLARLARARVVE